VNKKWLILIAFCVLGFFTAIPFLAAPKIATLPERFTWSQDSRIESNFYGRPENTDPVTISPTPEADLVQKGYQLVSESETLQLYLKEKNFNIAILDKQNQYIWYSVYPDYLSLGYSGAQRFLIESGVTLEYYNLDNILIDDSKSYLSGPKYHVTVDYDYEALPNGIYATINFNDLAISFAVEVRLDGDKLCVRIPQESIVEGDVEKKVLGLDGKITTRIISYRIRAIYLFPYFGSNNYLINGYSFIPDGSGALVRYDNVPRTTAYIKRLYGTDEGYRNQATTSSEATHIHPELSATMPVFGVNHGFQQAAFLAYVKTGSAATEIHSYPYGYNATGVNTTFAKYIYRERYQITTSSNINDSFQLINSEPFPTDFETEYHFLANGEASYSGMAKKFRDILRLEEKPRVGLAMDLSLIGMDYKHGLFGNNYVAMTRYQDAIDIAEMLKLQAVEKFSIQYIGWAKNAYYGNTPIKPTISGLLGGKADFRELVDYCDEQNIGLYVEDNPILSFSGGLGNQIVKKMTLNNFDTKPDQARLIETAYYRNPLAMADHYQKYQEKYADLGIDGFLMQTIGSALFSYRYLGVNHFREAMIQEVVTEIQALDSYRLGMKEVNSYLWKSLDHYFEIPIESNKFSYISDSIPFIQLVLSGNTLMTSPYINFISDVDVFLLRLIEYGVMPAFLITMEPTHKLRYTNYENVYTSEYALWEESIVENYQRVIQALSLTEGREMTSHCYILPGVAKSVYGSHLAIIVNYTTLSVTLPEGVVEPMDYLVVTS